MAEALGVAGSIVGLVSLGIQISQGLLTYYESWKNSNSTISYMYVSLENLSKTLEIIKDAIQSPKRYDKSTVEYVEEHISHVRSALQELDDQLKRVRAENIPNAGTRAVMRKHVRKLLYPFKEETLNSIQRVVAEARFNLDLGLQVLQLLVY